MGFRLTTSRIEIGYIALSVLAITVFALPLWYAWKVNIETARVYVEGTEVQNLVRVFDTEGARGLADAIESRVRSMSGDEVMVFTDASGKLLAGNLNAWPAEVPSLPMHGDDDQIVPIADSALLSAKLVRNGTLKVYPGLPHGMCTTHPN